MTRTRLCAPPGIGALVRAHKRALAEGGELRLLMPATAAVLGVFALTGIDRAAASPGRTDVPAFTICRPGTGEFAGAEVTQAPC